VSSPITNGVKLVLALKSSGTGESKLNIARAVLREKGANATSADVIAALEADPNCSEVTVRKAKSFAACGEWVPDMFDLVEKPIEEQLAEEMKLSTPPANVPPANVPPANVPPANVPPAQEQLVADLPTKKK
jgi:hypothetical protein